MTTCEGLAAITLGYERDSYRCRTHNRMQVVELGEDIRLAFIKEGIDGLLDDANGVIRPPVQVSADLGENVFCHVVEGVARENICIAHNEGHPHIAGNIQRGLNR